MPDRTARARGRLLRAASALVGIEPVAVLIVQRLLEVVAVEEEPAPAASPEGLSPYDSAILAAITDKPLSSQRVARAAGHRHNSYFRERLTGLVEAGHILRTRRGYRLPG